jgi:hypothetical protein
LARGLPEIVSIPELSDYLRNETGEIPGSFANGRAGQNPARSFV